MPIDPVCGMRSPRLTDESVALRLHVDEVRAEILPADRRGIVQELQRGHIAVMARETTSTTRL